MSGTQSIYLSTTASGFVNINGVSVKDTNASVYSSSIYDGSSAGNHGIFGIWSQGVVTPTGPTSTTPAPLSPTPTRRTVMSCATVARS